MKGCMVCVAFVREKVPYNKNQVSYSDPAIGRLPLSIPPLVVLAAVHLSVNMDNQKQSL
jgi:hypothetical protein